MPIQILMPALSPTLPIQNLVKPISPAMRMTLRQPLSAYWIAIKINSDPPPSAQRIPHGRSTIILLSCSRHTKTPF